MSEVNSSYVFFVSNKPDVPQQDHIASKIIMCENVGVTWHGITVLKLESFEEKNSVYLSTSRYMNGKKLKLASLLSL